MPESGDLQVSGSKLPAKVDATDTRPVRVIGRTGILRSLAVFGPLAAEVIYGLTRKWLAESTIGQSTNMNANSGGRSTIATADARQSGRVAGIRRRHRRG